MTRPCKVGVQLPEVERFVPWPEYLDLARRAGGAGYDSIWVGDHLIYDLPDGSTRGPYEAWTTLAAIAAVTDRVEIGPLVASTGVHAPAGGAEQAAGGDGGAARRRRGRAGSCGGWPAGCVDELPRAGDAGKAGRDGRRDLARQAHRGT